MLASCGRDEHGAGRLGEAGGLRLGAPRQREDGADRADQCHACGDAHAHRHCVDEGAVRGADQISKNILLVTST